MVQYYRTRGGLYYKEYANGSKIRVGRAEYSQMGGAAKKKSPRKSKSRSRSKSRRSPRKSPARAKISYTPAEQKCIDWAQAKITENKDLPRGTFKHIGHLVAVSYEQARAEHPECANFFDREKVRKAAEKAARKAAKPKRRRKRSRKGKKSKSKSRKSPRKSGKRKSPKK